MPRHRFALLVAPLLFSLAAEAKPEAPPRPTIVVAPLASSSAEEHAWIGEALSEALSQRLLASGEAQSFEALARLLLGDAKKAKALAERARKGAKPGWPDVVAAFISQEVGDAEGALKILRRAAKLAARQGGKARALEQLRAAVQAGFAERARFESDPDLAEVVKDSAFAVIFEGPSEPSPEKAPRDG